MKSNYFLQRSKPTTQKRSKRGIAISLLLIAIIFAVIMHLPRSPAQTVSLHSKPRSAQAITVPNVITTTVDQPMPYGTTTILSPNLPTGITKVTTPGAPGIWTKTYQQTVINGQPGPKRLIGIATTRDAVEQVVTEGTGPR